MGYIKVFVPKQLTIPDYDEQGNGFPRYLNSDIVQKLAGKHDISLRKVTYLHKQEYDRATIFQMTIDVIKALLDEQVLGIVIIIEQTYVSELAFFLSLFTEQYKKSIVIYSTTLAKYIYVNKVNHAEENQDMYHQQNIEQAIHAAAEPMYGTFPPITVINGLLYMALQDGHQQTATMRKINQKKNIMNDIIKGHKTLATISTIINHIGFVPVIPEKVARIKVSLNTNECEILNLTNEFPGVIIEMAERQIAPSVKQALQKLVTHQIPFIITYNFKYSPQRMEHYGDASSYNHLVGESFSFTHLHTHYAELLLGVMLAQNMSWDSIQEIIELINDVT